MGATEEFRKRQNGGGQITKKSPQRDLIVEKALKDSVAIAQRNLENFQNRVKEKK